MGNRSNFVLHSGAFRHTELDEPTVLESSIRAHSGQTGRACAVPPKTFA